MTYFFLIQLAYIFATSAGIRPCWRVGSPSSMHGVSYYRSMVSASLNRTVFELRTCRETEGRIAALVNVLNALTFLWWGGGIVMQIVRLLRPDSSKDLGAI